MTTLNEPAFYVPGSLWIVDLARMVDGAYRSHYCGETLEQIAIRYPGVQLVELDKATESITNLAKRPVTAISQEEFDRAMGELPPAQYLGDGNTESFKSIEHFSGSITRIFARIGSQHFTLRDHCQLPHNEIIKRCNEFLTTQATEGAL